MLSRPRKTITACASVAFGLALFSPATAHAASTNCYGNVKTPYLYGGTATAVGEDTVSCTGPDTANVRVTLQWLPPNSSTYITIAAHNASVTNGTISPRAAYYCTGTKLTRYRTAASVYYSGSYGFSNPSSSIVLGCTYTSPPIPKAP